MTTCDQRQTVTLSFNPALARCLGMYMGVCMQVSECVEITS